MIEKKGPVSTIDIFVTVEAKDFSFDHFTVITCYSRVYGFIHSFFLYEYYNDIKDEILKILQSRKVRRTRSPRLATSRPLGERSELCLAAKRPTASDEVARGPAPHEIRRRTFLKVYPSPQDSSNELVI